MKKIFALALAATAVVACSKSENGGNGDEPTPGQAQQLKVLTSINTQTKTAVDGTTLPVGSAIGVMVTSEDGTADFTPSATGNGNADGGYYTNGRNIRFANEAGENTWASVTDGGLTKLLLFAGNETGKVFGYYPYTEDANVLGIGEATTIPVKILNEGNIVVSKDEGQSSLPNGEDTYLAATAEKEIDFMYNTQNDIVGAKTTTTAKLVMQHALSRVSFRVYTSAEAQQAVQGEDQADSYYQLVGYTIKNKSNGQIEGELHAQFDDANTRMNIHTGEITGEIAGGEIARTIEGYKMERATENTPDANKVAANNSFRVSNLLFPLATITADANNKSKNIEVVFSIQRVKADGTAELQPVGYALPFDVSTVTAWEAGKNYTYTVKFTGNSLSIETVTVTDWVEVVGGNMEIE